MKKYIFIILSVCLFSCKQKEYKYKIEGLAKIEVRKYSYVYDQIAKNSTPSIDRPVIAITDTIYGKNADSIWYYNSNGSKVTILAPYKIDTLK